MIKNNIIKNTDHLQAEVRDGIGIIAFNRPEAKNALSDELTPELRRMLIEFESDRDVRVIIITGNGGSFCSGGDVKSFASDSDPGLSKDLSLDEATWPARQSQWQINTWKDDGLRSKDVDEKGDFYTETVNKIYKEYEELCIRDDLVDFGELLLRVYILLKSNEEVLKHYQRRFSLY